MKHLLTITITFLFTMCIVAQSSIKNKKYTVGDFAHGGIVFFVNETGTHGLVCAKKDQSSKALWSTKKPLRKRVAGVQSTSTSIFGNKQKSSNKISTISASKICAKLKVKEGGKTYKDWYLPSKGELNKLYLTKNIINKVAVANNSSPLTNDYYWSSTEHNNSSVWLQYFKNGVQSSSYKYYGHTIRAIRAF